MAMEESGGTAGGYTTGDEMLKEKTRSMCKAIGSHHHGPDGGGHSYHYHIGKSLLHHQHPADADPESLGVIKGDLEHGTGHAVTQGPDEPGEEGYEKMFPGEEAAEGEGEAEGAGEEEGDEDEQFVEKAKSIARLQATWNRLERKAFAEGARLVLKKSPRLQECVSAKIPKLLEEGRSRAQSASIAYSMCGERKALPGADPAQPPTPGMEEPADPADEIEDELDAGEEHSAPLGAETMQSIAQTIEEAMPTMEATPAKELLEGLLDELEAFMKVHYPGTAVAGNKPPAEEEEEESLDLAQGGGAGEEEEEANLLDRYKSLKAAGQTKGAADAWAAYRKAAKLGRRKRLLASKKKRYVRNHDLTVIKDAAEHLEDLGDMEPGEPIERMHTAASRHHAKALQTLHKALTEGGPRAGEEEEEREHPMRSREETTPEPGEVEKGLAAGLAPLTEAVSRLRLMTGARPA